MEEMASMTKQNANNAQEAVVLVEKCSVSAENGNKSMKGMSKSIEDLNTSSKKVADIMSNSMGEINTSSKKIGEITKMIEDIAFQTNLLAINAAVEGARAGESGRGFTVVAEEIRNLAKMSAAAAKDTAALIGDCANKADEGMELADKCREDMQGIVENVKKDTDMMSLNFHGIFNNVKKAVSLTKEISAASSEQSEGVNQVNNAIQQMDQVTQQNAATAEEAASASEELSAQADTLMDQVKLLSSQVGGTGDGTLHPKDEPLTRENSPTSPFYKGSSREIGISTTRKTKSDTIKHNENVVEDALNKEKDADKLIPMDEESIPDHDERFKDF
jgi:methyl-accepting chemotaxis protein